MCVSIADMKRENCTRYPLFLATAAALLMALFVAKAGPETVGESKPVKRFDPVVREIEGFKVHIDPKMLECEHSAGGAKALMMLASNLLRITIMIPEDRLKQLQTIGIWIEHDHPEIDVEPGPYHPGAEWLVERGYDERLAKKVHITRAASLLDRRQLAKHPSVVLHELSHAFHDQILGGYDEPRILEAYKKAMAAGIYDEVLDHNGRKVRAYAASTPMEYFAEGTEAYFDRNDFYPFVRAELKEHDPVLHDLLEEIWGVKK
jgi:dipeptidyl-peptidase-4